MSKLERADADQLLTELRRFYDESLVEPIAVGDRLHLAIDLYRESLPNGHLPPAESRLMREMLDLSRSKDFKEQRQSQTIAGHWVELLTAKYESPKAGGTGKNRTKEEYDQLYEEFESQQADDPNLTETAFASKKNIDRSTLACGFARVRVRRQKRALEARTKR